MEIIMIDLKTFKKIMVQLEFLHKRLDELVRKNQPKRMEQWVDAEYVCKALDLTKRTLQVHRETGLLAYSRIKGKIFYKQTDIEAFLREINKLSNEQKKKL